MNPAITMPAIIAASGIAARNMNEEDDYDIDVSSCTDHDGMPLAACIITSIIFIVMFGASAWTAYELVMHGASLWSWLNVAPSLAYGILSYWFWKAYKDQHK